MDNKKLSSSIWQPDSDHNLITLILGWDLDSDKDELHTPHVKLCFHSDGNKQSFTSIHHQRRVDAVKVSNHTLHGPSTHAKNQYNVADTHFL